MMSAGEAIQGQPARFSRDASTPIQTSIWKLPGIDKVTFYAAAIYLHVALGTMIDETHPMLQPSSELNNLERDFLDRLADCFARSGSKLKDARDHVSATAMVKNKREKKITVYIAKNKSYEDNEVNDAGTLETVRNENETFAEKLVKWFTDIAQGKTDPAHNDDMDDMSEMFTIMSTFSRPRLNFYIDKVSEADLFDLQRLVERKFDGNRHLMNGWGKAKALIKECKKTQSPHEQKHLSLPYLAGQTRKNQDFRSLANEVRISDPEKATELEELNQLLKWISYLGRHYSAHDTFIDFCKAEEQHGYSFQYRLLPSQEQEDEWNGTEYIEKIHSWTGDLGLTEPRNAQIQKFAPEPSDKAKARPHCEMQLLMHFSRPGAEKCEDYFGCSKKSCWLCWQMILKNHKYTMKDTHRKLFPRWAFPFDFYPSVPEIGEGLAAAYNTMCSLVRKTAIREKILVPPNPFPHTSTRGTPWEAAQPSQGSEFSYSPIKAPGRLGKLGKAHIAGLLLPSDTPAKEHRHVEVEVYIKTDDLLDRLLFSVNFKDHPVVFAFQLITMPEKITDSGFDNGVWRFDSFPPSPHVRGDFDYMMYYRTDMHKLVLNPTVSQIWKEACGPKYKDLPWRGDVFVFKVYETDFTAAETVRESEEFSKQDVLDFFESLEFSFQAGGVKDLQFAVEMMKRDKYRWLELSYRGQYR